MKISVKQGREDKIHIYVDDEYKLTVDAEYWYLSPWHNKKEIDEDEYEIMEAEIEKRRAFKNGVALCMSRLHSKGEIETKLNRKFSKEASNYAANKCEEIGIVNDEDFARLYAEELLERKGMGISRVRLELKRKGISSDIISSTLEEIEVDEKQQIKDLLERKYFRRLSDEKGRKSTFNALVRLGYSYSDIKYALEEFIEENEIFDIEE